MSTAPSPGGEKKPANFNIGMFSSTSLLRHPDKPDARFHVCDSDDPVEGGIGLADLSKMQFIIPLSTQIGEIKPVSCIQTPENLLFWQVQFRNGGSQIWRHQPDNPSGSTIINENADLRTLLSDTYALCGHPSKDSGHYAVQNLSAGSGTHVVSEFKLPPSVSYAKGEIAKVKGCVALFFGGSKRFVVVVDLSTGSSLAIPCPEKFGPPV